MDVKSVWKARRMRNNPVVRIAPATPAGGSRGEPIRARVRLLEGEEAKHAAKLLARRQPILQGIVVPLTHRLKRWRTLHYELTPES